MCLNYNRTYVWVWNWIYCIEPRIKNLSTLKQIKLSTISWLIFWIRSKVSIASLILQLDHGRVDKIHECDIWSQFHISRFTWHISMRYRRFIIAEEAEEDRGKDRLVIWFHLYRLMSCSVLEKFWYFGLVTKPICDSSENFLTLSPWLEVLQYHLHLPINTIDSNFVSTIPAPL